ncbi:hypothetical protein C4D60_Mb01t23840 [Musa balbisiana]|uniref:Uncharacterized protein n=1 Tax=Musa balbisiana TaxID=52838 RepID=A0A4S8JQD2_MUSBA|nr:hypothetical protein C4D60_Mb01t23840 [Musa balbisiana]
MLPSSFPPSRHPFVVPGPTAEPASWAAASKPAEFDQIRGLEETRLRLGVQRRRAGGPEHDRAEEEDPPSCLHDAFLSPRAPRWNARVHLSPLVESEFSGLTVSDMIGGFPLTGAKSGIRPPW